MATRKRKSSSREAAAFARLCATHTDEGMAAFESFCLMLRRALAQGRLCTVERIRILYPVVRAVNNEIDQIARREARFSK